MNQIYDRHTIEHLKVQLQHSIQELLTNIHPDADDIKIISRAMTYIVTSHNSFKEQYFRIKEYLLIINALQSKYSMEKAVKQNTVNAFAAPLFYENESPF